MQLLDWLIVLAYLTYVIYDGVSRSRSTDQIKGYFLANRSLPWWAVGLSIMATQMSAITLVGTTGQAYSYGMGFIQFYFGLPFAMILLCVTVVPFFYRAKVFTAYEYLERRFDNRTRSLTSFFFLISRGLSCGVIVSAPAVILSVVLGWSFELTVLAIGVPTIVYTMLGGVQAVTWTDVKQMVLILAGLAAVIYVIVGRIPGEISFTNALSVAGSIGHLETFDFSTDLNSTYTFWSGLIGGFFLMLSYFGCDQSQVQRFLTAKSESEGRTSLLMSAILKIPLQFLILLIGVLTFLFFNFSQAPLLFNPATESFMQEIPSYKELVVKHKAIQEDLFDSALAVGTDPENEELKQEYRNAFEARNEIRDQALSLVKQQTGDNNYSDINYIFPSFVINHLPVGLVGLMIAAIFAAAMSSISAELNSLSTASVMDFYRRRFRQHASEKHYLIVSKIATGFWGLMACAVAIYAVHLGSLIEVVNRFGSFFYGSLLGVFILAIGTRWATAPAAFWGLLSGIVTVALVSLTTEISFLWYNVIGTAAVLVTGFFISWLKPNP
jgi:Na+/proline symporter